MVNGQLMRRLYALKPGSHMSPMIGESLSVTVQGENSQRILLIAIDNGRRRCRRHMRTRLNALSLKCISTTRAKFDRMPDDLFIFYSIKSLKLE